MQEIEEGDARMEVISFREMEKLVDIPENSRPKDWKSMVIRYLNNKFAFMNEQNSKGRDTEVLEKQFVQSVRLARRLGIVWTQK